MATPPNYNYGKAGGPSAPPPGGPAAGYGPYGQAGPPPYGAYQQPPPPAMPGYQPPPPSSSKQQQQQQQYQQQPAKVHTSHGLLGSLGGLGKDVAKGLSSFASEATTVYSQNVHGNILAQLVTGTTIVLISRMSGRSLEIVQSSDGRLIADAACVDSPQIYNNKWVATKLPSYYLFSNYNNYLAIDNGQVVIVPGISNPGSAPPCARFKLYQTEHFVLLESAIAHGQYVAANERGELKPPVATSNDKFAHFGVQFVSYQQPAHR